MKKMPVREEFERWRETTLRPALERSPERGGRHETTSGIQMPLLALPGLSPDAYDEMLGFPGEYPFTRGVQPSMYRSRLWTMRQYAGYGTAEETNGRYLYLLQHGQTGLSVAFDLPTQLGYDPDDPLSHGEVGKVGVSIASIRDMETLFRNISLEQVSTSMTINAPAAVLLAMYVAIAKRQGATTHQLRGTVQNDILKEYVARGTYIFPPAQSMRLVADIFEYCSHELPHWNTISISGYHIREAGATAVQELAFTLSNAIAYVDSALRRGLLLDEFAPRLSFFFSADRNFLEEIAKFRAARRLWAGIMRQRFGALSPASWQLRFHTQTAGSALTAQQPENNVVRVTLQALAAVLGGTQSLHTNSQDEALWLPAEPAVRLALRTQQIIAYESGVTDSVDPLAGSYVIEHLTDEIERLANRYISHIDELGGALQAIERGYMQAEIQEAAYVAQRDLESGEHVVVGVNQFQTEEQIHLERAQVDPAIEARQKDRLAKLRLERDATRASELMNRLEKEARAGANILPLLVDCVENDLTLGEICRVLRGVWGEYQPPTI
jgi:methylmalonyl-CoA mutase N-terminal domain/subunit